MDLFDVIIDGKKYEYVDSIDYKDKKNIAISNGKEITIKQYTINDNQLELQDIDDETFEALKGLMQL